MYDVGRHAFGGEEVPEHLEVGLIIPGWVRSEIGPPEAMAPAMDTDRFTRIIAEQMKAGEQFLVSHAYDGKGVQAWQLRGDADTGWSLERAWTNRRLKVQHGNGVLLGQHALAYSMLAFISIWLSRRTMAIGL